ncbi:hypothetical protein HW132_21135 [Brasilonema sp. CT11]|nr:hypothetical protein [Brasilonema sp. CT11]
MTLTNYQIKFATDDQSMWGSDSSLRDERFLGTDWNTSGSKTILDLPLKFADVRVYGSTSGRIGLQSDLQLDGRTVDASVPVDVWMEIPDKVRPGETITIKSGFSIEDNATFSASTTGSYDLDVIFGAKATAGIKFGSHTWKPLNFNIEEQRKDLLYIDSNSPDKNFPLSDFGNIDLHFPSIRTQGYLAGSNTLSAQGSDRFFTGRLDLDKLATTGLRSAGVPVPDLEGDWSGGFSKWGVGVSAGVKYNLLDTELAPALSLQQKFDLAVDGLTGQLILENGDTLAFKVGEDITFTVPEGIGDSLEANAVLDMDASFRNKTSLGYDVDLDLKALELEGYVKADLPWPFSDRSGSFGIGPVFDKHFDLAEGEIASIYDQTFDLNGFNSQSLSLNMPVVA